MLKKCHRLKGSKRFLEIRRKGRTLAHPLLVMMMMPNELAWSRFGLVAGRRIGKAVKRNRARRLMREAIRLRLPHIAPGYDVILVARQPMQNATFAEVERAVESLLKQAGLFPSSQCGSG